MQQQKFLLLVSLLLKLKEELLDTILKDLNGKVYDGQPTLSDDKRSHDFWPDELK
jgi:hypothetical protein